MHEQFWNDPEGFKDYCEAVCMFFSNKPPRFRQDVRLYNILVKAGINTLKVLRETDIDTIASIKSMGKERLRLVTKWKNELEEIFKKAPY